MEKKEHEELVEGVDRKGTQATNQRSSWKDQQGEGRFVGHHTLPSQIPRKHQNFMSQLIYYTGELITDVAIAELVRCGLNYLIGWLMCRAVHVSWQFIDVSV